MNKVWSLALVACACSSPHSDTVDAGRSDGGKSDGGGKDAAAVDGAPLEGNACPGTPTEVARLASAISVYPYLLYALMPADLDGAGGEDILLVENEFDSQNEQTLLRLQAILRTQSGFAAPVVSNLIFPQYGPEKILLGDFNGDHLTDVAISYTDSSESRTSYVYIAMQQADHTFVLGNGIDLSACSFSDDERYFALAVIDVDHDGYDDLLATISYDGLGAAPAGLSLLKGSASGLGFASCAASANVSNGFPALMYTAETFRVDDFDGDGVKDVAALYEDRMRLFRGTGASQFTLATNDHAFDDAGRVVVDHVAGRTGQGLVELNVDTASTIVTESRMNASGVASSEPIATLAEGAPLGNYDAIRGYAVGDFNGDGLTDVLEVGNHDYSDNEPGPNTFGLTCDRSAHWDIATGSFPASVYQLTAIDYDAGHTDAILQTDYDLVIYQLQ